ncbi:cupin domain-containing protein [Virgibacillus senegalensis]|uniref:cupin domain-containing protein n=1 Tax=Virgibacillus senegalensis TaxID=1499679 RepID=UPI00069D2B8D|nr:cupin domain-containing protein [Virgibacillus senegalensis]
MTIIKDVNNVWKKGFFHNSQFKMLWREDGNQSSTEAFIVKFEPGGFIPKHDHPGREYAYVLDGEMKVDGETLKKGDFLTAGEGEIHDVSTDTGVTFLIIIEKPIHVVEEF